MITFRNLSVVAIVTGLLTVANTRASGDQIPGPQLSLGEKWTTEDSINAQKVLQLMRKKLVADTGTDAVMKRDAHPKHHGCVKSYLTIDPANLPKELRVGLFEKSGTYQSLIRFSNASPNAKQADSASDPRGFSLKVMNVPYAQYLEQIGLESANPVHDFVFMNSPAFFNETTEDYVDMVNAVSAGGLKLAMFALTHPRAIAVLGKASLMKVGNPLDLDYHSALPYQLGTTSMRMKFGACKTTKDEVAKKPHPDFLGIKLAETLAKEEACFNFYVQVNREPNKNDVEKPMSTWEERKSPYILVGRLLLPKQNDIRSEKRQEFCENISFNPWRSHPANRPLGKMNRVRLQVYSQQAQFRQQHNNANDPLPRSFSDVP